MATTNLTSVDEVGDPITSAGPVDPGVAQLIREEVQAAIKDVHETFYAPPSYSSSAPLLGSTPADDVVDTEAQQPAAPTPMTLWDWGRFVAGMAPIFTWVFSWGVLVGTGVDPLAFSMLAFFLMIGLIWVFIILACIQFCKEFRGKLKKPDPIPLTPEAQKQAGNNVVAISFSILGVYLLFYGIIWGWAVMFTNSPTGVWHLYGVSRDLQAKIDVEDALSKLAACLQEAIPGRNATIADFSTCLKGMGMEEAYEKWMPTVLA